MHHRAAAADTSNELVGVLRAKKLRAHEQREFVEHANTFKDQERFGVRRVHSLCSERGVGSMLSLLRR